MSVDFTPDARLKNGQPGYSQPLLEQVAIADQINGAGMTTRLSAKPREKAEQAIEEMSEMAKQLQGTGLLLGTTSRQLVRLADEAKTAAVQSSDKIKTAYDRMAKVDLEKMVQYATAAERLVAALCALDKFSEQGKLAALVDTLNRR
jgi:methyl-accepting chemotaxis protein